MRFLLVSPLKGIETSIRIHHRAGRSKFLLVSPLKGIETLTRPWRPRPPRRSCSSPRSRGLRPTYDKAFNSAFYAKGATWEQKVALNDAYMAGESPSTTSNPEPRNPVMRLFILALLSTLVFAGDPPTPQPLEVQNALAAYEKSVVAARKVYDAAEAKIRSDAVAALQKAQEGYLKKGDLEGAVLVKEAIKKLNGGETLLAVEENIKTQADLFGDSKQKWIGKWKVKKNDGTYSANWVISADKKVASDYGAKSGTWEIDGNGIVVKWIENNKAWEKIAVDGAGFSLDSWKGGKKCGSADKVKN